MNVKRTLGLAVASATILVSSLTLAPAASASPRINVGIRVNAPPPPLRHEAVLVRPGRSHVWVPGHWDWAPNGREYVWVPGAWVRPSHRHARWVGPRWERHGHDTFYIRGHWR